MCIVVQTFSRKSKAFLFIDTHNYYSPEGFALCHEYSTELVYHGGMVLSKYSEPADAVTYMLDCTIAGAANN